MKNQNLKITSLSFWLLGKILPASDSIYLKGNFEELYENILSEKGRFFAFMWVWKEIIKSFPGFFITEVNWRLIMFKNILKIAFRNCKRPLYSFLNIIGLTLGLACFILFFFCWQFEKSYDNYHPDYKNIYRISSVYKVENEQKTIHSTYAPFSTFVKNQSNIVKKGAQISRYRNCILKTALHSAYEDRFYFAESAIFDIFEFHFISGNKSTALTRPNSVVLTKSMALKYFDDVEVVGKTIQVNKYENGENKLHTLFITGVMSDTPMNTSVPLDFIASFDVIKLDYSSTDALNKWSTMTQLFLLIEETEDFAEVQTNLSNELKRMAPTEFFGPFSNPQKIVLTPLTEIHMQQPGLASYLNIFGLISLFILLLACINYVNLTTALAQNRINEIGIKKVVGADRIWLIRQFLIESICITFIAALLALVLVDLAMPLYQNITSRVIQLNQLFSLGLLLRLAGIVLIIGILSGCYPAFYLSKIRPSELFQRNRTARTSRSRTRKILVLFQFAVLCILILFTFTIFRQLDFIENKDLGYDNQDILILTYSWVQDPKLAQSSFKNKLLQHPKIVGVSWSHSHPPKIISNVGVTIPGSSDKKIWDNYSGTPSFLKTFSINLISGRNFYETVPKKSNEVLINQSAAKLLGYDDPIGKKLNTYWGCHYQFEKEQTIIGVVKDFHLASLHHPIQPLIIEPLSSGYQIMIKFIPNSEKEVLEYAITLWAEHYPNFPVDYVFLEDEFRTAYTSEYRLSRLTHIFVYICFIIAGLGLIGLVSHSTTQRRKEMAVRKTLGANFKNLVWLLYHDYSWPILLSNIIAWPIGYWLIQNWLSEFAYQMPLRLDLFFIVSSGILVSSLGIMCLHIFKTARTNPVESLKYE